MSPADQYLQSQLGPILQPGEQVIHTAYMRRQPGLLMQLLLVGGLLLFLMTKAYFAVMTNRRLILIRTKMGFWTGGPKSMNLGVEEIDARAIKQVTVSGFANNRSMTFHLDGGRKETLRISPWFKQIAGTKAFFEELPKLVASGALAAGGGPSQMGMQAVGQLGAGQPQMQQQMQQPGMQAQMQQPGMQQPQMQAQMQQPQMQAQMQQPGMQQPQGFGPGARVQIVWQDGNRYPATVVQSQNGHYLCAMQDGQQHWVPQTHVLAG